MRLSCVDDNVSFSFYLFSLLLSFLCFSFFFFRPSFPYVSSSHSYFLTLLLPSPFSLCFFPMDSTYLTSFLSSRLSNLSKFGGLSFLTWRSHGLARGVSLAYAPHVLELAGATSGVTAHLREAALRQSQAQDVEEPKQESGSRSSRT
jgi:hypothetical protein